MKNKSLQPFFIAHSGLLAAVADTCGWWLYGQARKDLALHKHSVFVSRGKYGFGVEEAMAANADGFILVGEQRRRKFIFNL